MAHPFNADRTITFGGSGRKNTVHKPDRPSGSLCDLPSFHYGITIDNPNEAPSRDAFYGPWFSTDLRILASPARAAGVFTTHPYDGSTGWVGGSTGVVSGQRQD